MPQFWIISLSIYIFRFGNHDSHRDSFRNPIWQSDEDDDDDDVDNFR